MSKNKCINCHFCCKADRIPNSNVENPRPLSQTERCTVIKNKNTSFLIWNDAICQYITCYRLKKGSMWPEDPSRIEVIRVLTEQRKCDDFWTFEPEYKNNLLAIEKKLEDKKESRKNRFTWLKWFSPYLRRIVEATGKHIIGIVVATGAIIFINSIILKFESKIFAFVSKIFVLFKSYLNNF